jgi:feruloyl esterase
MLRDAMTVSMVLFAGAIPLASSAMAADNNTQCAALMAKTIGDATIERAEVVNAGDYKPQDGQLQSDLPTFCRLRGVAKPTPRSNIHFEVWMPLSGWTGRIDMVGNHGNSAAIFYNEMATLLRAGNVAMGTDTGHTGSGEDYAFGDHNDDVIADWINRSTHESIVPAKALVAAFYAKPAQHSYFLGCSSGGHQALTEATRWPDDFDGILGGDPANNRTNLNLAFLERFLAVHPPGDNKNMIISAADLQRVNHAVMEQCDAADGVRDGILANPQACHFDISSLRCSAGKTAECFDDKQIEALEKMYGPTKRRDNGEVIYAAFPITSEWLAGTNQGLHTYFNDAPNNAEIPKRGEFFRKWVFNDPSWNWWNFDWSKGVDFARKRMGPLVDTNDTDMAAFRKHGGKLIMYTGWVDPVVSALDVAGYYERLTKTNANAADFSRFYMVPGMGHCGGGPGATHLTFAMNADGDHDLIVALHRWVEQGTAPKAIVATRYKEEPKMASGVAMTRPVCPWPQVQTYTGKGSTDDAANFQCR